MKFSISSFVVLSFLAIFIFSFFPIKSETTTEGKQYDPLLVVVLMVKDEEPVICQTLETYLGGKEIGFFIFDTGSTDNTISMTEEFFKKHSIENSAIAQEPFIDFATSRNRALQLAQEKFPNAGFILMPDAEWYLQNVNDLIEFCKQKTADCIPSYLVRIGNSSIDFWTPRLIRCRSGMQFVGVVHEVLNYCASEKAPSVVRFELGCTKYGSDKSYKRWKRDAALLLKKFEENPKDPRTTFYLAQTYDCLGELEEAYKYYEIRTKLPGWDEENFMAMYRLAQVAERRGIVENNSKHWWPIALDYYLQAYSLRPSRTEPLIKVAQHYYYKSALPLVFCFSRQACEAPYPESDSLFVDKNLYDFDRHDLLGIAAWYVNQFSLGEEAVKKALKARPDMPHLYHNLSTYMGRKQAKNQTVPAVG